MPEGPEIRRAADRLSRVLAHEMLETVYFGQRKLKRFEGVLTGARVEAVTSRGKAMLTHFDSGLTLYTHNQLYGRWYVQKRGRLPATNRTLRVALHTAERSALLYSASEIAVLDRDQLASHPFLSGLGPDVLDSGLTWRTVAERLQSPAFRGRSLAALYLDQGFLAGVGNYLRSEILFDAAVNPFAKPKNLTRGTLGRLARSTLNICQRAYATAGTTNPPQRVRRLQRKGATRRQFRFAVFDRPGEPCYLCGEPIVRTEAGSRRLYLCECCQSAGPL